MPSPAWTSLGSPGSSPALWDLPARSSSLWPTSVPPRNTNRWSSLTEFSHETWAWILWWFSPRLTAWHHWRLKASQTNTLTSYNKPSGQTQLNMEFAPSFLSIWSLGGFVWPTEPAYSSPQWKKTRTVTFFTNISFIKTIISPSPLRLWWWRGTRSLFQQVEETQQEKQAAS